MNSFRTEALLGGQPSVSNTARAMLRAIHRPNGGIPINNLQVFEVFILIILYKLIHVIISNLSNLLCIKKMAENIPIWGHIFILLRQGHYQDALQVAQGYKSNFSKQDQTFIVYFTKFINNNNRFVC